MTVEIVPIPLRIETCYVLRAAGVIAIDAGPRGQVERIARRLVLAGIQPADVRLIVLTHGHWDHVGSAADLKALTGAKLAMHEAERAWLERPLLILPPATTKWGKVLLAIQRLLAERITFPAATVDVILGDEPLSLQDYGIPGRVLHTPGHSPGSVSILLDSGEAFVGDLAMHGLPQRLGAGLPVFGDDTAAILRSWRRLVEAGARTIYPAHGQPFPADVMRRAIA